MAKYTGDMIDFYASIVVERAALLIRYRVVNRGAVDIYLLNRLYKTKPVFSLIPDNLYIELDRQNNSAYLYKRLADLPENGSVTFPVAPYVTAVRSQGTFEEEIHVPIPLVPYTEYGTQRFDPTLVTETITLSEVRFEVGYYQRSPDGLERASDVQGVPVILPYSPSGIQPKFGRLLSEEIKMMVQGVVNKDK